MPKLYTLLGIVIRFYSDEHEPIHVHAQKAGRESVFEVLVWPSGARGVRVRPNAPRPLSAPDLKLARSFVEARADEIAGAWAGYFERGETPAAQTITRWKP